MIPFPDAYKACTNLGGFMPCPGDKQNEVPYAELQRILDKDNANGFTCYGAAFAPVDDNEVEGTWACLNTGETEGFGYDVVPWNYDQPNGYKFQNCMTYNNGIKYVNVVHGYISRH